MKLNKKIIDKYNSLYMEVADYYGLQDKVKKGKTTLYFIDIHDLGYRKSLKSPGEIITHIEFMYPYLSNFYRIYHHEYFIVSGRDFHMMNWSIEEIRKEKSEAEDNEKRKFEKVSKSHI